MKKFLLMSALCLGIVSPMAQAVTTTDLDGKVGGLILYGNPAQYGFVSESIPGYFEKIDNTNVIFHNFYGGYDVQFTLSANKLSFVAGTSADRYDFWPTSGATDKILNFYKANQYRTVGSTYYYDTYTSSTSYNTFTSTTYAEFVAGTGFYRFQFNYPLVIEEWTTTGNCLSDLVYNGMDIFVIDTNSIAIDNIGREYKTGYTISGSNIAFTNFFNIGVRYINQTSGTITSAFGSAINGTISGTNITVPYMEVSGVVDFTYQGWTNNGYTATAKSTTQYLNKSNYISSNGNSAAITGKRVTGKTVSHLVFDNNWVQDENIAGSAARTVKGEYLEMGRIVYPQNYYYAYSLKQRTTDAAKTYIFGANADVTHKVALNLSRYGYGLLTSTGSDKYLYAEGKVTPGANADYVESYEIYAVPGTYSAVTDKAFNNTEKGHDEGVALNDYMIDWRAGKAASRSGETEGFKGGEFAVLVPATDLSSSLENYTFYVKTNYTAESGLEPTFHALALTTPDITTGIDDVLNLDNDNDAPVIYYNMNGVQVDGDNLTPGLYIRRQGNTATKVIIK